MQFTVQQIADLLGGEVKGNASAIISNIQKIQEAQTGDITFLANPKYEPFVYTTKASAVIVNQNFSPKEVLEVTCIVVEDAYNAFSKLLLEYEKLIASPKLGIEQPHFMGDNVKIGEKIYLGAFSYLGDGTEISDNVKIFPQVYIGENVKIASGTIIHAGVKIYANTEIGKNCVIQAGAVIGSEGFGFARQKDGAYQNIPQLGKVTLEDNVHIGANTTIDRATLGATLIQQGSKLDNLIQIAHNVVIGKNTVIAAQAGIAGSSEIGDDCMIGGQAGLAGHIYITNKTIIGAQAGVGGTINEEGKVWQGTPAIELRNFYKSSVLYKNLPDLFKQIQELEKKILNLLGSK